MYIIDSLHFLKNQNVVINDSKIICNQDTSTPGIYKKIYVDNDKVTLNINITGDSFINGKLLLWISDNNRKTLHISRYDSLSIEYTFIKDNTSLNIIHIGILFSGCITDNYINIDKFSITSDSKIGEIFDVFSDGYVDKFSAYPNDVIGVYGNCIDSNATNVAIYDIIGNVVDIVDIGHIESNTMATDEPWKNGFGYVKSFDYTIPCLRSGIYLFDNKIPFIIKSHEPADFVILYPFNTFHAYNPQGGKSLYYSYLGDVPDASKRAKFVSIHRSPFKNYYAVEKHSSNFFKWLWKSNYSYKVISDIDMDISSETIDNSILVIVGHNEYWSQNARNKLVDHIVNGKHVINMYGNTLWWKIKYNSDHTVINCDKEGIVTTTFRSFNDPPFNILVSTLK